MPDEKLSVLAELTLVADEDLLYVVDDPSGTPQEYRITRANFVGATTTMFGRFMADKGADVASADAITLGSDGNVFDITGTTTINHIMNTGWQIGSTITLHFDDSLTLTHNAGSLTGDEADMFLAGNENFVTTAGDIITFVLHDATSWQETSRNSAGGAPLTPWTENIDADGFDLTDLSNIEFRTTTGSPTATDRAIWYDDASGMNFNALTGDVFTFLINGGSEYTFSSTTFNTGANNIFLGLGAIQFRTTGTSILETGNGEMQFDVDAGDYFEFRVDDISEYTFSSTEVDLLANNIRNAGFMESNATNPASAGTVRLGNTETVAWRNAGNTEDFGISLDASNYITADIDLRLHKTSLTTLELYNESSPSNGSNIGNIDFYCDDSNNDKQHHVRLSAYVEERSTINEGGGFRIQIMDTGTLTTYMQFRAGDQDDIDFLKPINMNNQYLENFSRLESNAGTPSTTGALRFGNNEFIGWRNQPNNNNVLLGVNTSSELDCDGVMKIFQIRSYGTSAVNGFIRLGANEVIGWRNSGNTNNHRILFDGSDRFTIRHDETDEYYFSSTAFDLLGNNIINCGYLDLDKITFPADPSTDHARLYFKEETTANDGLYIKGHKNSTFIEQKISNIQDFSKIFFGIVPTNTFYAPYTGGLSASVEELVRIPSKFGGRIRWLRSHTNLNTLSTATTTVALRINGTNQLSFTISAGSTTDQEDDNISAPIEFDAEDDITAMVSVEAGGSGTIDIAVYWQIEWDITS